LKPEHEKKSQCSLSDPLQYSDLILITVIIKNLKLFIGYLALLLCNNLSWFI